MMDDRILELTENNISQRNNRFFLDGKPGSIVIVEFVREKPEEIDAVISEMINELKSAGYGYSFPVVKGKGYIQRSGHCEKPVWVFLPI